MSTEQSPDRKRLSEEEASSEGSSPPKRLREELAEEEKELKSMKTKLEKMEEKLEAMEQQLQMMEEKRDKMASLAAKKLRGEAPPESNGLPDDLLWFALWASEAEQQAAVGKREDAIIQQRDALRQQRDALRQQRDAISQQQLRIGEQRQRVERQRQAEKVPSALDVLIAAERTTPFSENVTKQSWTFSHPACHEAVNLMKLAGAFKEGEDRVLETLKGNTPSGPLILAVQTGMGIGKSHCIDIAHQLLFVGEKPLVLKVTYNQNQQLAAEQASGDAARAGLLARVVLAVHRTLPADASTLVKDAIEVPKEKQLTEATVARYIHDQDPPQDPSSPTLRPVIIAVDEIAFLSAGNDRLIANVLSGITALIKALRNCHRRAIGIMTALPNVDIMSISKRTVQVVNIPPFTEEESRNFLTKNCPDLQGSYHLEQILGYCGNHPRSLAIAVKLYKTHLIVPPPQYVAAECSWKINQRPEPETVVNGIKESYEGLGGGVEGSALATLRGGAVLMKRDDGRWMIPPTVLWCNCDKGELLKPFDPVYHLTQMFLCGPGSLPTKQLEVVNRHWDFFRCKNKMKVIPELGIKVEQADGETELEIRTLTFCFVPDEISHKCKIAVLGPIGKCLLDEVTVLDYYEPEAQNHRGFESMCVAKATNGTEYLCLFQCKINAEAKAAVEGLNQAAKDLSGTWKGKHLQQRRKFLFIVYALEAKRPDVKSDHPLVLITECKLDAYFTPTLASAVRLQMALHKQSLGKVPAGGEKPSDR